MVKAIDYGIAVSKFELQSFYYIYVRTNTIGKGMKLLILLVIGRIVAQPFSEKDAFGIK